MDTMENTGTSDQIAAITVDQTAFRNMAEGKLQRLLSLARYLERLPLDHSGITRPILGEILSQCSQNVEFFDAYGAKNNSDWHFLRHLTSSGKLFSRVGYTLLHIKHSLSAYKLLPVKGDFYQATDEAIRFNNNIILCLVSFIVCEAIRLKLNLPEPLKEAGQFDDNLPPGKLPHDRMTKKKSSASETVAHLTTAFLNLAAESDLLHITRRSGCEADFNEMIPDPVSEEKLRILEQKFHNLQSLYDTYVSDTDTELLDPDLKYLRGHISVIFHLLEAATLLCHYYERYLLVYIKREEHHVLVDSTALINTIFNYQIAYSSKYLENAVALCQEMLSRYAKKSEITVPVPKYRGFHVRPSTLVAKICLHYGSDVKMILGEEVYDASAPLDLFRANEYINAVKRRKLAEEVTEMQITAPGADDDISEAVRLIVYALAYKHKIVIYEHPLPVKDFTVADLENTIFAQVVITEIARLLAMGKLDIESDLAVHFEGDERVLVDLDVLARTGYGEDEFGNNIPLPSQLAYLRR